MQFHECKAFSGHHCPIPMAASVTHLLTLPAKLCMLGTCVYGDNKNENFSEILEFSTSVTERKVNQYEPEVHGCKSEPDHQQICTM